MFQSVPGVGGEKKEEEGLTREELQEQERLRSVWGGETSRCQLLLLVESVEINLHLLHLMC